MNEFPIYAIYNGEHSCVFEKGQKIRFLTYTVFGHECYHVRRGLYKLHEYYKDGYATYTDLRNSNRGTVHISELLPYE